MSTYKATTQLNIAASEIYNALLVLDNYKNWLPKNRVKQFEVQGDQAVLELQGLGSVVLSISDSTPNQRVEISPLGKAPVEVQFEMLLNEDNDAANLEVALNAKLNPMMKMMAGKILQDFVVEMAQNIKNDLQA